MSIDRKDSPKRIAIALLVALSAITPAWAKPGGEGSAATTNAAESAKATAANPSPASPLVLELEQLRESLQAQAQKFAEHSQELDSERAALHEQLDRIAALEAKLGVVPDAAASSAASTAIATATAAPIGSADQPAQVQTPQDWSTRISNLENSAKKFGPFTLSGDFRLRDEPFFGGPADHSLDRHRARYRLRFNVDTKLNDDVTGGFTLASGDVNDPISTNQNVSGFYTRKPFFIDRAYVTYSPHEFKELTLTGGKFAYPWYNTELTWDKDLNPEGLAQTLAFNLDSAPVLKRVAFVGFELPFTEAARASSTNKSIVESVVYGGQLQTTWQLASWLKFGAYSGFYNFHHADPIALALARASSKNPQTPLSGVLPLQSSNGIQNSVVTTTSTNVVTIAGTSYPTGVTSVTNAQFASKFGLLDSLARFDITTPSEKWPIAFIGDYVQNTEACANVNNIVAKPANTASIQYTQTTNFACNPHQRRGYWGEAQVGRAKKRGDWQFDYARIFIEREAVLSNFDYSELRQGSNVTEHRASVLYQAYPNVQLSFTGLFGRPLNFGSTKPPENILSRLQFDVLYTF
ncbi:MAG: putative porin [Acidobacteriia bacterium]|nr:putative porin [Terriglobia bacterium]